MPTAVTADFCHIWFRRVVILSAAVILSCIQLEDVTAKCLVRNQERLALSHLQTPGTLQASGVRELQFRT
jgi:hypothetical protein